MAAPADREWVAILRTTDDFELQLVRSLLDVARIPHEVQGEAGPRLYPLGPAGMHTTGRMLGASIRVPADREEEARALIRDPDRPAETDG